MGYASQKIEQISAAKSQMKKLEREAEKFTGDVSVLENLKSIRRHKKKLEADLAVHKAAVSLGRRGGLKGGKARAEKLTPERRSEIAKTASEARWRKQRNDP